MSNEPLPPDERCAGIDLPWVSDTLATARRRDRSVYSATVFWLRAWLGTAVAGGVFGMLAGGACGPDGEILLGGIVGLVCGAIMAGMVGIPIHITIGTMTWVLWLSRFSVAISAVAGALTGMVATSGVAFFFGPRLYLWITLAALIGGLGGALAGGQYRARFTPRANVPGAQAEPRWQFSIRDVLLRFAVVAALVSAWKQHTTHCETSRAGQGELHTGEVPAMIRAHRATRDLGHKSRPDVSIC